MMQQPSQIHEEDAPFVDLLQSMGITEFDPTVAIALNEYATRKRIHIRARVNCIISYPLILLFVHAVEQ